MLLVSVSVPACQLVSFSPLLLYSWHLLLTHLRSPEHWRSGRAMEMQFPSPFPQAPDVKSEWQAGETSGKSSSLLKLSAGLAQGKQDPQKI